MVEFNGKEYPVSDTFKVLDAFDVFRTDKFIVALVVTESQWGKGIRLYRWQNRNGIWKVDLCRMGVSKWDWKLLTQKVEEFKQKWEIEEK